MASATLYRHHKMLFLVTYAPSDSDSANRDFFKGIPAFVKSRVTDWDQRHVVWLGDHNNIPNPVADQLPSPAEGGAAPPHPMGAAAFGDAAEALRVRDAFRHYRPSAREFTRVPRGPVASRTTASRRLDRVSASTSLLRRHGALVYPLDFRHCLNPCLLSSMQPF